MNGHRRENGSQSHFFSRKMLLPGRHTSRRDASYNERIVPDWLRAIVSNGGNVRDDLWLLFLGKANDDTSLFFRYAASWAFISRSGLNGMRRLPIFDLIWLTSRDTLLKSSSKDGRSNGVGPEMGEMGETVSLLNVPPLTDDPELTDTRWTRLRFEDRRPFEERRYAT
jgi:hypothetical protein